MTFPVRHPSHLSLLLPGRFRLLLIFPRVVPTLLSLLPCELLTLCYAIITSIHVELFNMHYSIFMEQFSMDFHCIMILTFKS